MWKKPGRVELLPACPPAHNFGCRSSENGDDLPGLLLNWGVALLSMAKHAQVGAGMAWQGHSLAGAWRGSALARAVATHIPHLGLFTACGVYRYLLWGARAATPGHSAGASHP